jgi:hypothetical protein
MPTSENTYLPGTPVNKGKKKGRSPKEVATQAQTHLGTMMSIGPSSQTTRPWRRLRDKALHPLAVVSHCVLGVRFRVIPASPTIDDIANGRLVGYAGSTLHTTSVRCLWDFGNFDHCGCPAASVRAPPSCR